MEPYLYKISDLQQSENSKITLSELNCQEIKNIKVHIFLVKPNRLIKNKSWTDRFSRTELLADYRT